MAFASKLYFDSLNIDVIRKSIKSKIMLAQKPTQAQADSTLKKKSKKWKEIQVKST